MVLRRSAAAIVVCLALVTLTGCAAEDTLSPLNNGLDATAPSAPVNVSAVALGSSVHLDWDASSEADVVGYDVYRYDPDPARESAYVKVNAQTILDSNYLVTEASVAGTWYRVKAVDLSTNRSAASGAAFAAAGVDLAPPSVNEDPSIDRSATHR